MTVEESLPSSKPDPDGPWMRAVVDQMDATVAAVRTAEGDWNGRELIARAAGASRLIERMAPPGQPIPALLSSTPHSMALTLGGAFCGRPLAPLGARLTVAELVPLIQGLGAGVLVADPPNSALGAAAAEAAGVRLKMVDHVEPAEPDLQPTRPDSVVLVLHTSGTTGRPKAVLVRDAAVYHRAVAYQKEMGLSRGDLYCSAGAFHHTGGVGMLFVALASGSGVIPFPRFTVDAWLAVAGLGATCALLVPTMIDLLLEKGALAAVPLRGLHYGTAPIHPQTLRAALATLPGTEFTQAYGMTEGGPITLLSHAEHLRALAGEPHLLSSVGRAAYGVEMKMEPIDGERVAEVVARAGQIFQPDADGWLHTGDLGVVDDEGFVFLQGRHGDKIIRGGENVYPLEVERVLELHPLVAEAAVVGVVDKRWGQTIKAFVVAKTPNAAMDVESVADHARKHLAGFKVPEAWEVVDSLPRNAAGKLLRRQLV